MRRWVGGLHWSNRAEGATEGPGAGLTALYLLSIFLLLSLFKASFCPGKSELSVPSHQVDGSKGCDKTQCNPQPIEPKLLLSLIYFSTLMLQLV